MSVAHMTNEGKQRGLNLGEDPFSPEFRGRILPWNNPEELLGLQCPTRGCPHLDRSLLEHVDWSNFRVLGPKPRKLPLCPEKCLFLKKPKLRQD
jgi:hypothetical protein